MRTILRMMLFGMIGSSLGCATAGRLAGALQGLGDMAGAGAANTVPGRPRPPRLLSSNVRLAAAPSNQQLAAYYCAQRVDVPSFVSPCRVFGEIPTRESIQFRFAVDLTLENQNAIPLPVAEALLAFTAFPSASGQQNLGALCVDLDREGAPARPNPSGCRDRQGDIRTVDDFGRAAVGFLFAVATGREDPANVRIRTIPPGGNLQVTVTLGLDPETTVNLVRTMSERSLEAVTRGQTPRFTIPYRFEGTVWVNVERFGRFAVAIPPVAGEFNLQ